LDWRKIDPNSFYLWIAGARTSRAVGRRLGGVSLLASSGRLLAIQIAAFSSSFTPLNRIRFRRFPAPKRTNDRLVI
jgi:hypothetical protein